MDKRKSNGGHSTKTNGIDRRKNEYKNAISKAITEDDIVNVLQSVRDKALRGDTRASELLLSYTLGKPSQAVELTQTTPEYVSQLLALTNTEIKGIYGIEE